MKLKYPSIISFIGFNENDLFFVAFLIFFNININWWSSPNFIQESLYRQHLKSTWKNWQTLREWSTWLELLLAWNIFTSTTSFTVIFDARIFFLTVIFNPKSAHGGQLESMLRTTNNLEIQFHSIFLHSELADGTRQYSFPFDVLSGIWDEQSA